MLNLTRKDGETIIIGENIRIIFLECRRGRVRVGIEAPREFRITREEHIENNSNPLRKSSCASPRG